MLALRACVLKTAQLHEMMQLAGAVVLLALLAAPLTFGAAEHVAKLIAPQAQVTAEHGHAYVDQHNHVRDDWTLSVEEGHEMRAEGGDQLAVQAAVVDAVQQWPCAPGGRVPGQASLPSQQQGQSAVAATAVSAAVAIAAAVVLAVAAVAALAAVAIAVAAAVASEDAAVEHCFAIPQ